MQNDILVLYVLTKLELGGAQKVCLALLEGVQKELNGSLISGTEGPLVAHAKKYKNVFLINSLKREVGIKTFLSEFSTFFAIIKRMRALKKQHPNIVVHTHSTKAGLMGRWAAFFARIKKRVHTVHGFGFHEHQSKIGYFINLILEWITSFITTHYVCVSRADQKIGIRYLHKFEKKSSIIRAAVAWNTFFQPAMLEKQSKTIVFGTVSCLKPQKNLIDLLKAFKSMHNNLKTPNVELHIVGDGMQRAALEEWIKKHNLQKHILLLGWQNDVAKWMRSWDVFVMSSLWEGLPCAIVEARLSKLPVISYRIAGIPEVITDGKNGFLVDAGDWKVLSQRMQSLVQDESLRNRMSTYQDNLFDFSNDVMVAKHVSLYKKLFKNF